MKNLSKNEVRLKRKKRVRAKIFGTAKKPRMAVFRSLKNIYIQVIDDNSGKTLAAADLKEISSKSAKNNIDGAKKIGELIAQKCGKIKISEIIFDRGGYKYHGRVKALAEAARKGGLKF